MHRSRWPHRTSGVPLSGKQPPLSPSSLRLALQARASFCLHPRWLAPGCTRSPTCEKPDCAARSSDCHPTCTATPSRGAVLPHRWSLLARPGVLPALPPFLVTGHAWRCSTQGQHCFVHLCAFLVSPQHERPTRGSAPRMAAGTMHPTETCSSG